MFLFGMNMMSEGLQKAAGDKMKKILALLTKNPVLGVLAGALVTAVLQSSSATTVMVIGFVSAGLMTLPQAISVILGANIGTTMTAQLMAFKISDYIWLIVFIGFMISFLAKNEKVKNIGQTIFAFGALFVGIETMGSVMKPLAGSPVFVGMIERVSHIPVLGVCVGALMTLVVQSSSATIAVLQNFASQAGPDGVSSVIGLIGAIPILLGDNIGTTITALLASIGQSKNAKRTAVAHSVFNISGSILFVCIIPWFARFIQWISPKGPEITIIARQIANAHTTFNIVCTLLWLPFIGVLVRIVRWIIRGEDQKETAAASTKYLDYRILNQPAAAIQMVGQEIEDMSREIQSILFKGRQVFQQDDSVALSEIKDGCDKLLKRNEDTLQYLASMFAGGSLAEKQAEYVSDMLVVLENLGNITHRLSELDSYCVEKIDKQYEFSKDAREELGTDMNEVIKMYDAVLGYLLGEKENPIEEFNKNKEKMIKLRLKARKNNAKRMEKKSCQKESGKLFNQIIFALERIHHDCFNMLENNISQFQMNQKEENYNA